MLVGIDPKVDYAFKHLLGREATKPLLIDLIENVLSPDGPGYRLEDIELLNPFNPKESLNDKLSILDIKARDRTGRQFNVEMQMLSYPCYEKRILYYSSKFHQQQLHQGDPYSDLMPTISISFLNHVMFPNVEDYHLCFRLLERKHHFALTDDMEFHIVELPKFMKSDAELTTRLDSWLYFLRYAEKIDTESLPPALQQPLFKFAMEELHVVTQDEIERERYESRLKALRDFNSGMIVSRREGEARGRAEGIAEGRAEGIAEGRAEGIAEGRAEGRAEGLAIGQYIATIHLCERLLNRTLTPDQQLERLPLADLAQLADGLEKEAFKQR